MKILVSSLWPFAKKDRFSLSSGVVCHFIFLPHHYEKFLSYSLVKISFFVQAKFLFFSSQPNFLLENLLSHKLAYIAFFLQKTGILKCYYQVNTYYPCPLNMINFLYSLWRKFHIWLGPFFLSSHRNSGPSNARYLYILIFDNFIIVFLKFSGVIRGIRCQLHSPYFPIHLQRVSFSQGKGGGGNFIILTELNSFFYGYVFSHTLWYKRKTYFWFPNLKLYLQFSYSCII